MSAHIPVQGLRCWELPWTPGSSHGLRCPSASAPRAAAMLTRIPPHPSCLRAGGGVAPGTLWICPAGGPRAGSPRTERPVPGGGRGQRARRHRCRRTGCQGAAICVRGAARLGGPPLPPATPPRPRGTAAWQDAVPPQNSVLRALGGCVGRGPGPCREEGSGGGLAACLPSSLCEVVGPLSPLRPSGRPVRPPPQARYPSPGLGLPTPMGQYGVCVGPTETRGGGGAGQRVAGLPRRARQRGHLGTIEHRHPVPGCVSQEGGL